MDRVSVASHAPAQKAPSVTASQKIRSEQARSKDLEGSSLEDPLGGTLRLRGRKQHMGDSSEAFTEDGGANLTEFASKPPE